MFYAFQELMHQIALLPFMVMLVLRLLLRTPFGWRLWILAAAFVVSWSMDSTDVALASGGYAEFITRYGNPLQIALVLTVLVKKYAMLSVLLAGLVVVSAASALQGIPTRELVVPTLGGFVVSLYAWRSEKGLIRSGLLVKFGLGAVAWVAWSLAASEPTRTAFVTWFAFQGTRLAGILLITAALVLHARKPRLELV